MSLPEKQFKSNGCFSSALSIVLFECLRNQRGLDEWYGHLVCLSVLPRPANQEFFHLKIIYDLEFRNSCSCM